MVELFSDLRFGKDKERRLFVGLEGEVQRILLEDVIKVWELRNLLNVSDSLYGTVRRLTILTYATCLA